MTKTIHVLLFLIAAAVLAPFFGVFVVLLSVLTEKLTDWFTSAPIVVSIALVLLFALLIYSLIRDKVLSRQKTLNIVLIAVGILCPFLTSLHSVVPSAVYRPIHWTACVIACIAVLALFALNESELKKLSRATLLLICHTSFSAFPSCRAARSSKGFLKYAFRSSADRRGRDVCKIKSQEGTRGKTPGGLGVSPGLSPRRRS